MKDAAWLMRSLEDASAKARELPKWATDVNDAVDKFYNKTSSDQRVELKSPESETKAESK